MITCNEYTVVLVSSHVFGVFTDKLGNKSSYYLLTSMKSIRERRRRREKRKGNSMPRKRSSFRGAQNNLEASGVPPVFCFCFCFCFCFFDRGFGEFMFMYVVVVVAVPPLSIHRYIHMYICRNTWLGNKEVRYMHNPRVALKFVLVVRYM